MSIFVVKILIDVYSKSIFETKYERSEARIFLFWGDGSGAVCETAAYGGAKERYESDAVVIVEESIVKIFTGRLAGGQPFSCEVLSRFITQWRKPRRHAIYKWISLSLSPFCSINSLFLLPSAPFRENGILICPHRRLRSLV